MRALLFALVALTLALAAPTDPPVPEAAVVEVPPPPPPPFPEYRECVRWLVWDGHAAEDIQSWQRHDQALDGDFITVAIVVRTWTVDWTYTYHFDGRGKLQRVEFRAPATRGMLHPYLVRQVPDLRYHHGGRVPEPFLGRGRPTGSPAPATH